MKGIFYLLNKEEENRYLNLQIITNNFLSENVFSFDDKIICFFPVLEGTKYSDKFFTLPSKAVLHYINSMGIDWNSSSVFNINCRTILEKNLNKKMFKQHSLYLLKESMKLFSKYSKDANNLLNKLNEL